VTPGRITTLVLIFLSLQVASSFLSVKMPPSRQERRKAMRDAAKRAPAQSGAAGTGAAAAARATVNVNQLGDWSTQTEDPMALFRALGAVSKP
jgi:hypothetical protein